MSSTATQQTTRATLREIVGSLFSDEQLDRIAAAVNRQTPVTLRSINAPAIGAYWPEHGGNFMGIANGEDGQPDYLLIRGAYAPKPLNHAAALKFATDCKDGGHTDWQLPNRTEGALLYANGREDMRSAWHWLKPQSAGYDAYAWCQLFSYGYQYYTHKSNEFEVVLVRRVPIQ